MPTWLRNVLIIGVILFIIVASNKDVETAAYHTRNAVQNLWTFFSIAFGGGD
jgi:hypothetical protein